ncbi:glycoside hydrolase family 88 protein [Providencia huaxiensis]|uniref:glycoside hydrolase family 88 protein n=1 Tax=Providencia huaxiensis TaxID=2027290 RepID=UPI0034DD8951
MPDGKGGELREKNGKKVFLEPRHWLSLRLSTYFTISLPQEFPARQQYVNLFTDLMETVIQYQQEDRFLAHCLLDPQSFPAPESSALHYFAMDCGV